jgi:hypothetical protein
VTKKDTIPRTARHPRKMEMKTQTWFQKHISKICFNPRLRKMLTKREKQKKEKESTDMDEYSLDMNVFDMFTGKHNEIISKNDDDSMSITNNLFHFEQTNEPDKCFLKIIRRRIMMKLLTHLVKE